MTFLADLAQVRLESRDAQEAKGQRNGSALSLEPCGQPVLSVSWKSFQRVSNHFDTIRIYSPSLEHRISFLCGKNLIAFSCTILLQLQVWRALKIKVCRDINYLRKSI